MGGVLFYKSKLLVSSTLTCHDPGGHTNNSIVTTCADGKIELTEDEGLGVNICCSSASALWRAGKTVARAGTCTYLKQREIQLVEPVIFERSDFEEQQENSGKQDKKEDGVQFPE